MPAVEPADLGRPPHVAIAHDDHVGSSSFKALQCHRSYVALTRIVLWPSTTDILANRRTFPWFPPPHPRVARPDARLRIHSYFEREVLRKRPYLQREWCLRVLEHPIRSEPQSYNRWRFWAAIPELDGRYLRVVTLRG